MVMVSCEDSEMFLHSKKLKGKQVLKLCSRRRVQKRRFDENSSKLGLTVVCNNTPTLQIYHPACLLALLAAAVLTFLIPQPLTPVISREQCREVLEDRGAVDLKDHSWTALFCEFKRLCPPQLTRSSDTRVMPIWRFSGGVSATLHDP